MWLAGCHQTVHGTQKKSEYYFLIAWKLVIFPVWKNDRNAIRLLKNGARENTRNGKNGVIANSTGVDQL